MKRRYKPNVFRDIYDQPYSDAVVTRMKLYKSSKNSLGMVQRLDLLKRLPVHNGCVNSISWNETGDYILSGSDDQHIVITQGFNHKVLTKVKTSHRANIFSAKFLPGQGDRHIVSCSGDGIILFTDLNRPQSASPNTFSCHLGTTYDVITVPGDAHSFLSCGEDGTVRWFDLRVKDKCRKSSCKDDILITCERAVTSLSLNPTATYQLAVGCSDSRVRLFDRRMLGTVAAGYAEMPCSCRPLCTFTVPALKERSCRITSLNYSPDGEEILVSFSSDLLYLFSLRDRSGGDDPAAAMEDDEDIDGPSSERSPAPVRRLRLRGDWSDTGPNARPERDGGAGGVGEFVQTRRTLHSSLMQRMTDVLSRMLNDPATRANLNGGRGAQTPEEIAPVTPAGEEADTHRRPESPTRSPVFPFEHPLNESFSVNPFLPLESPVSPDPEQSGHESPTGEETLEPDQSPMSLDGGDTTAADDSVALFNAIAPSKPCASDNRTFSATSSNDLEIITTTVDEFPVPSSSQLDLSVPSNSPDIAEISSGGAETKEVNREDIPQDVNALSVELDEGNPTPSAPPRFTIGDPHSKMQLVDPTLDDNFRRDSPMSPPPPPATESVAIQATVEVRDQDEVVEGREEGSDDEDEADSQQFPRVMYPRPRRVMIPPGDIAQLRSNEDLIDTLHSMRHRHANEPAVLLSVSDVTDTGAAFAVRLAAETERGPPDIPFLPRHRASREELERGLRGEQSSHVQDDVPDENADLADEADEEGEDSTPRHRTIHPIEQEMDEAIAGARRSTGLVSDERPSSAFQPSVRRVFSGHRNARTMIKEACFWGTDYVMSGSDCGHVFVWDRTSGRLVQLLEGDDHVVNCLQPHPTLPVLATSGIDYDVKLWAPMAADTTFDTALADMLKKRNEIMLEETKDTITVPATFMIRMLACLNQIRRGARRNRRTDDESNE